MLIDVIKEVLEVAIHEILYGRQLYPECIFENCHYLGIEVHASARNPDIHDYISNMLRVGVPALCEGTADGIYLVIYSDQCGVLERYGFEFDPGLTQQMAAFGDSLVEIREDGDPKRNEEVRSRLVALERSFRDLILEIVSLPANPRIVQNVLPDDATFKLCLRATSCEQDLTDKNSSKIIQNEINEGRWMKSMPTTCDVEEKRAARAPMKNVRVPSCGLYFNFSVDRISNP